MKKRNPAAVLLLPFVTFGIYCIYWLYATRRELVAHNQQPQSIPPVSVLFLPACFLITIILVLAVMNGNDGSGTGMNIAFIILTVAGIASLVMLPLWWFYRYCRAASATVKQMDFAQMYVLYIAITWLVGLFPVWMLIVQLELNKLIEHHEQVAAHPHATPHQQHPHPGV